MNDDNLGPSTITSFQQVYEIRPWN